MDLSRPLAANNRTNRFADSLFVSNKEKITFEIYIEGKISDSDLINEIEVSWGLKFFQLFILNPFIFFFFKVQTSLSNENEDSVTLTKTETVEIKHRKSTKKIEIEISTAQSEKVLPGTPPKKAIFDGFLHSGMAQYFLQIVKVCLRIKFEAQTWISFSFARCMLSTRKFWLHRDPWALSGKFWKKILTR